MISRTTDDKLPRISGKEAPGWLVKVSSRDTLYLVDEQGEAAAIPVHSLPETDDLFQGLPIWKTAPLHEGAALAGLFALPSRSSRNESDPLWENRYILTATSQGMVKKSVLSELPGASANSFTLVKVNPDDRLGWLHVTNGQNEILLVSQSGMAIRFSEEEVRPMGLVAAGVMGIKLAQHDLLAGMEILPKSGEILLVTSNGKGKRLTSEQFPVQGRYGQGVTAWKLPAGEKIAGLAIGKGAAQAAIHSSKLLPKTIRFDEAPLKTRATLGQAIMELKPGNQVTRLTVPQGMVVLDQPKPAAKKSRTPKPPVKLVQASLFDEPASAQQIAPSKQPSTPNKPPTKKKKLEPSASAAKTKKPDTAKTPKPNATAAKKTTPVESKRQHDLTAEAIKSQTARPVGATTKTKKTGPVVEKKAPSAGPIKTKPKTSTSSAPKTVKPTPSTGRKSTGVTKAKTRAAKKPAAKPKRTPKTTSASKTVTTPKKTTGRGAI